MKVAASSLPQQPWGGRWGVDSLPCAPLPGASPHPRLPWAPSLTTPSPGAGEVSMPWSQESQCLGRTGEFNGASSLAPFRPATLGAHHYLRSSEGLES